MNATTRPGLRHGRFLAWLGAGARTVIADARRHRLVFVAFGAIWALALTRVFIHHTPILPVLFNWTASLPYRIVVVDHILGLPGAERIERIANPRMVGSEDRRGEQTGIRGARVADGEEG